MAVDPLSPPEADDALSDMEADDSRTIGAPAPSPDGDVPTQAEAADGSPVQPPVAEAAPRPLKLVVTVSRDGDGGRRAVLALGSDGCDPLLRVIEAGELEDALQVVPELLAEAEARWQLQPRYPVASPTTPVANWSARTQSPRASSATEPEQTGSPAPRSAEPDQMTLFA
jgi:hypothetical protein